MVRVSFAPQSLQTVMARQLMIFPMQHCAPSSRISRRLPVELLDS
jgi:hypothetical protein